MAGEGNNKGSGKNIFLYALGAGILGGAAYFGFKFLKGNNSEKDESISKEENEQTPVAPKKLLSKKSSENDNFPLKSGSRGNRVLQLQEAIEKILGKEKLAAFIPKSGNFKDGIFKEKTEAALRAANLPTLVDEATFNKILSPVMIPGFNPQVLANKIYTSANRKDMMGVMESLAQIQNTSQYSAVNAYFLNMQLFSVSKSIVTYLLDAFSYRPDYKEKIKAEFLRFGLKLNNDGKWSLSGIHNTPKDIVTIVDTYVTDKFGNRIKVRAGTILGEQTSISNGVTYFKDIKDNIHIVPSRDVTYA